MTTLTEPARLGDILNYEADQLYSREEVTIASGQNLPIGTVIGRVSADGKVVQFDPSASDGSETPAGILCESIDATAADTASWIAARHAIVSEDALVWPEGITAGQLSAATVTLKNLGILVRKGA